MLKKLNTFLSRKTLEKYMLQNVLIVTLITLFLITFFWLKREYSNYHNFVSTINKSHTKAIKRSVEKEVKQIVNNIGYQRKNHSKKLNQNLITSLNAAVKNLNKKKSSKKLLEDYLITLNLLKKDDLFNFFIFNPQNNYLFPKNQEKIIKEIIKYKHLNKALINKKNYAFRFSTLEDGSLLGVYIELNSFEAKIRREVLKWLSLYKTSNNGSLSVYKVKNFKRILGAILLTDKITKIKKNLREGINTFFIETNSSKVENITYITYYKPWQWLIIYRIPSQKLLSLKKVAIKGAKKEFLNQIYKILFVFIIFFTLSYILSKITSKNINNQITQLRNYLKAHFQGESSDYEKVELKRFHEINNFVNTIIKDLEENKFFFELVFDAIPNPIFLVDKDLNTIVCNKMAATIFKIKKEEIEKNCFLKLFKEYEKIKEFVESNKDELDIESIGIKAGKKEIPIRVLGKRLLIKNKAYYLFSIMDLSEIKKTEKEKNESIKLFKTLTEQVRAGIFTFDKEAKYKFINKRGEEITGYKAEELTKKTVWDIIHPDFVDIAKERAQKRLKGEDYPKPYEVKIVRKNGEVRWVELSNKSIVINGERTVIGTAIDITEWKRAGAALKESEKQFRTIFEKSADPMLIINERKIINLNKAAIELLNIPKTESKEYSFIDISFKKNNEESNHLSKEFKKLIKETLEKGFTRFQWVLNKKKGGSFWANVSFTKIRYENKPAIFVIIRDISEIKELEVKLEGEKERLSVTLKSIGDGVIATDKKGKIILMNRAAEKITGWKQTEAIGEHFEEVMKLYDKESMKKLPPIINKVLKEEKVIYLEESVILQTKKGEEKIISDSASPILDKESKIVGVVIVFSDITEKTKTEEELAKHQKIESLALLAGGIAHDFNNILAGLFGNLELAKTKLEKNHPAYKHIAVAGEALDRATSLTSQLLTFSKGGEPIKRPLDLKELIKETAEFTLSGSNVKYYLELLDNLDKVCADRGQINQVLSNLIVNAREAMPNGGNLYLKVENVKITKRSGFNLKAGKYVRISIQDTGIGIPENLSLKIFEPYFTRKSTGKGLGLATSYSIIKKHKGLIEVESEEGKGTTFYIFLPSTTKKINKKEKIKEVKREKTTFKEKRRALILDDEESIRELLKEMLENLNFKVDFTKTGEEAIKKFKENHKKQKKYDILIFDLTIPGAMGGKEAIEEIIKIEPKAKVIVSSGYSNDTVMSNYKEYGFVEVLPKPYKFDELKEILERVLKGDENEN